MGIKTERETETERERETETERGGRSCSVSRSVFVPETGIEPAHPCGRQILSLLRLPIPPPGLVNYFKF